MKFNIKIKKDTPFDKIGTILSLETFKLKYNYLINTDNSDIFLAKYLKEDNLEFKVTEWFEILESNDFKVGDWIFHNKNKKALKIINYESSPIWKPNNVTIGAVNQYTKTYTRLATSDEINDNTLWPFLDEKLLIGKENCYYFNYIWHKLENVTFNIRTYLNNFKANQFLEVAIGNNQEYLCNFSGLKIGSQVLTDTEIRFIAKILNISYNI